MTNQNSKKHLIIKYIKHIANVSILVAIAVLISLAIIFTRLSHHKEDVQLIVKNITGIEVDYKSLNSGFTIKAEPYLNINNLLLQSAVDKSPILTMKKVDIVLSYQSILSLAPVFNKLLVESSNLNFVLKKNGDITLNNFIVSNINEPSTENRFGYIINRQDNINIKNIDISFTDELHNFKPLIIDNYNLYFDHTGKYSRKLIMSANIKKNQFISNLEYDGLDTFDYKTWQNGELVIKTITPQGYNISLNSLIVDHQIDYIKAHANSNHNIFNSYSQDFGDITGFNGDINITNKGYNKYKIDAKKLFINTKQGYLLKNASISGDIDTDNGGALDIRNIKLDGINSLISYLNDKEMFLLSGSINNVNVKWYGNIKSPQNLNLKSSFYDISLTSKTESIPSFTNLSGNVNSYLDNGTITLMLKDSIVTTKKYLYDPIKINNLNSIIKWKKESDSWQITWKDSSLKTSDFTLKSSGDYFQANSHLNASLSINEFNTSHIYKYLPTLLEKSTVTDLRNNLQGNLKNLQLTINGDINKFPFSESDIINRFAFSGNFVDVQYLIDKEYPTIKNTSGAFHLDRNRILNLSRGSATFSNIKAQSQNIQIPDIFANNPFARGTIHINGTTNDSLQSITETPYKKYADAIIDKVNIVGNNKAVINFRIPLDNPQKLTLDGKYVLQNNDIEIHTEKPQNIHNFNAIVSFNQKGLTRAQANGTVFDSLFNADFKTQNIIINFPQLNYSTLINDNLPMLESIIGGSSATNIDYNMKNNTINISSILNGVYVNTPAPLGKTSNLNRNLSVIASINNKNIQATYGEDILKSNIQLDDEWLTQKISVNIGNSASESQTNYATNLNINLDSIYLDEWSDFFSTINKKMSNYETISTESSVEKNTNSVLLPAQINLQTNAFWYKNYNMNGGTANATIYPHNLIIAEINTPDINGRIGYSALVNNISLDLERLILSQENNIEYPKELNQQINSMEESDSFNIASHYESSVESLQNNNVNTTVNESSNTINKNDNIELSNLEIPDILIHIKNLYINNAFFGEMRGNVIQQNHDFYIENFSLHNSSSTSYLNSFIHCPFCNSDDKIAAVNLHSSVHNFGNLVNKFSPDDMFKDGKGSIDISAYYNGDLLNFDTSNLTVYSGVNIENGVLMKVKPGIFGTFMGVVSLGAISSINSLNFNNLFGQRFPFNSLRSSFEIKNNIVDVNNMELDGDSARVNSLGKYDLENQQIDAYATVEPKFAGTIATTAGIVTLNPLIGGIIYLAQKLIGDPINKLLSISFQITGDINKPKIKPVEMNKQIMDNFKSSMSFIPLDEENK